MRACFNGTRCPARQQPTVHHVVPVVDDPTLAYELSNLRTLCHDHHVIAERGGRVDSPRASPLSHRPAPSRARSSPADFHNQGG